MVEPVYNLDIATGEPESNCYPVEPLDFRKSHSLREWLFRFYMVAFGHY